jgi:hypothetical protein
VPKPYNDVYEEVVEPLLENSKLDLELGFLAQSPLVVFGIVWCYLVFKTKIIFKFYHYSI